MSLLFFAFTTIIGIYYTAETHAAYLTKKTGKREIIQP
ncbi:alanine:cation symporter family protein [Peribacillus sp. NPDC006672]